MTDFRKDPFYKGEIPSLTKRQFEEVATRQKIQPGTNIVLSSQKVYLRAYIVENAGKLFVDVHSPILNNPIFRSKNLSSLEECNEYLFNLANSLKKDLPDFVDMYRIHGHVKYRYAFGFYEELDEKGNPIN